MHFLINTIEVDSGDRVPAVGVREAVLTRANGLSCRVDTPMVLSTRHMVEHRHRRVQRGCPLRLNSATKTVTTSTDSATWLGRWQPSCCDQFRGLACQQVLCSSHMTSVCAVATRSSPNSPNTPTPTSSSIWPPQWFVWKSHTVSATCSKLTTSNSVLTLVFFSLSFFKVEKLNLTVLPWS